MHERLAMKIRHFDGDARPSRFVIHEPTLVEDQP